MLLVVTARTDKSKFAQNHVLDDGCNRMFCGDMVPVAVMEIGLKDPRNPYVGKGTVTCRDCISELNNGRKGGFREIEPPRKADGQS